MLKDREITTIDKPPILDIKSLDEASINILRTLVRNNNSSAGILVHPFYREYAETDETSSVDQYHHSNRERDFISDYPGVIFVFEELSESYDATKLRILFLRKRCQICMIPTEHDNPKPVILPGGNEAEQWQYLINILKHIGVKNLDLGGRELYITRSGQLTGCLQITKSFLGDSFNVNFIPKLCYPDTPY